MQCNAILFVLWVVFEAQKCKIYEPINVVLYRIWLDFFSYATSVFGNFFVGFPDSNKLNVAKYVLN